MKIAFYDLYHSVAIKVGNRIYKVKLPKWVADCLNKLHRAKQRAEW